MNAQKTQKRANTIHETKTRRNHQTVHYMTRLNQKASAYIQQKPTAYNTRASWAMEAIRTAKRRAIK